jgi:hypothetical protein
VQEQPTKCGVKNTLGTSVYSIEQPCLLAFYELRRFLKVETDGRVNGI